MTTDDFARHLDRRARRYRRRQRQLDMVGTVLRAGVDVGRKAKRRWWPSFLIAVLLDRDIPQQRPVQRGEAGV